MKNHAKNLIIVLTTALLGLAVTGCEPPQTTASEKIWVASDMTALTTLTQPSVDKSLVGEAGQVQLFAAANETVSFQIIVDAPDSPITKLSLTAPNLMNDKDATAAATIRIFRVLPVAVKKFPAWYIRSAPETPEPAGFYDVLLPLTSPTRAFDIEKGRRAVFWIDVSVAKTTKGGTYKGKFTVSSGAMSKNLLNVELRVYDFALPETKPLIAAGGFDRHAALPFLPSPGVGQSTRGIPLPIPDSKSPRGQKQITYLIQLGRDHGVDLFAKDLKPAIQRDAKGNFQLDWDNYDKIAKPYLDGSAFKDKKPCPIWPIPFTESYPIPENYGGMSSESYSQMAGEFVSQCVRHFHKLGAKKQAFAWPTRQKPSAAQYAMFSRLAGIIRLCDPSLPIMSNLPMVPPLETGWAPPKNFASYVDIVAPSGRWFDPQQAMLEPPSAGSSIVGAWISPGPAPYIPEINAISSPSDVRAIAWFAMKYDCKGIFIPEAFKWEHDNPFNIREQRTQLLYPGRKFRTVGVLPSVQIKRLRRGLQDTAYIQLLRSQNKKNITTRIVDAMVRYAGSDAAGDHYLDPRSSGWIASGELWVEARRLMAAELQGADDPKTEYEKIDARVRWGQFINKTHRVRIEKVTTKILSKTIQAGADGTPGYSAYTAKILVDLQNEFNRPLDTQLDIANLPEGWTAVKKSARIEKFAPGGRKTVELIVEGKNLPENISNAKFPVGFVVFYDGRMQQQTGTFIPVVSVGEFSAEPKIDGRVSDWGRRKNSVAGNFRLLGRRGRIEDSPFAGLAKRQTTVQIMQDATGENLYFAIICREPRPDKLVAQSSNSIRHDQLLATDEDIVEILLDPGNNADGPEDLYHIVVKPNGVIIQKKGIATDPALCKSTPVNLAAKFAIAISQNRDAWIIEMKIPRASFGPDANAKFWGVNFTRFSTAGLEASSWAKTERNFYDPKSLGTMILPNRPNAKENK